MFRISFSKETVKQLKQELEKAYVCGDLRVVRRLSVLIMIAERMALEDILAVWNVSQQTVYIWLKAFVRERWDSLEYGRAPGRPPRLTKSQKSQLSRWIEAGPEAQGQRLDRLHFGHLVVGPLQVIVRNPRSQVMNVMQADVSREPLQHLGQSIVRTSLQCRLDRAPLVVADPIGVLKLVLPKAKHALSHKISVRSAE